MVMKNIIAIAFFFTLLFSQNEIEGRWHLVGYEDNVMYQFVDTELFADAGYRYTIYSIDGNFGDLDEAGGSPNPYSITDGIITINLFFGIIVSYQMIFRCEGQIVDFKYVEDDIIHSTLFREGYNYNEGNCQCENGEVIDDNPCNPMECFDGQWYEIIIDCAENMGFPCEGGLYIDPNEGECCSECILFGDINYDHSINILDVVEIVHLVLIGGYNEIVDVNYDGTINVLDIIDIIQIILD